MCLAQGRVGSGGTYPRAERISRWVQFSQSAGRGLQPGKGEDLPKAAPWLQVPRTTPRRPPPRPPPRASCTSGVASAPVSQHRLPELKCLLTLTGSLWTRLGSAPKTKEKNTKKVDHRAPGTEEDDSELQRAWGALIKEKEQSRQKKSRLDNLPSLQIEVSRESSSGSEAES